MKTKRKEKTYSGRNKKWHKANFRDRLTAIQKGGDEKFYGYHVYPEQGFCGWTDFNFVDVNKKIAYSVAITTVAYIADGDAFDKATEQYDKDYIEYFGHERKIGYEDFFAGREAQYDKSGHITGYKLNRKHGSENIKFHAEKYGIEGEESPVYAWEKIKADIMAAPTDEVYSESLETEEYNHSIGVHVSLDVEYITKDVINEFIDNFLKYGVNMPLKKNIPRAELKGMSIFGGNGIYPNACR